MSDPSRQLGALLKKSGFSLTAPRKAVFDTLQHKEAQTMSDVVATCQEKVNRASVYRTVQLFEQLDIVQRVQIGWKYKLELSDKFSAHHHHLTCVKCNKTVAVHEDVTLEKHIKALAKAQGYVPQDHQFEIRGLCPTCA